MRLILLAALCSAAYGAATCADVNDGDNTTFTCDTGYETNADAAALESPDNATCCSASACTDGDGAVAGTIDCDDTNGVVGGVTDACTCGCATGWETADLGVTCTASVCTDGDGAVAGTIDCDDTNGVVGGVTDACTCGCAAGWETADLGVTCTDIIECVAEACDTNATCTEQVGDIELTNACACNAGFSGDGTTCAPFEGCETSGDWTQTANDDSLTIACGVGFDGDQTATCTATVWGDAVRTDCVARCMASDEVDDNGDAAPVWAETAFGESVTDVACGAGWSGLKTRACGAEGVWADVDDSACTMNTCTCAEGDEGYVAETAFRSATGTAACDSDKALCIANGDCMCDAAGAWAETACGADAAGTCAEGFTGSTARGCLAGTEATPWAGAWAAEDAIVETCTAVPVESESSEDKDKDAKKFACSCAKDADDDCAAAVKALAKDADETACTDAGGAWAEVKEAKESTEESSAAMASAVVALFALLL